MPLQEMAERRRRRWDLEFRTPGARRSPATSAALLQWLSHLSAPQRMRLFAVENPWLASLLRHMFTCKLQQGQGGFTVSALPHTDRVDHYFTFSNKRADTLSERTFEQQLRFCDTHNYLDTITLSPYLLQDFAHCLSLAHSISHGAAFQTPCLAFWDPALRVWIWQCPPWVLGTAVSLAAVALAAFEKCCWIGFFKAVGRDPRAPGETQLFAWEIGEVFEEDMEDLAAFWVSLSIEHKTNVIGTTEALLSAFHSSETLIQAGPKEAQSCLITAAGRDDRYYSSCRTRLQHYCSPSSLALIHLMITEDSPGEYISFLLFSSLERAETPFDLVARKTAERIKEALKAHIAEDLMKSEVTISTQQRKGKGKKKKKKRQNETTRPKQKAIKTAEIDPYRMANDIINDVINRVYQALEDTAEFLVVQPGRKKHEKGAKLAAQTLKNTEFQHKIEPSAPFTSPAIQLIVEDKSEAVRPVSDSVSVSSKPPSYKTLTYEAHLFKVNVWKVMVSRKKTVMSFLKTLQEVVIALFPTAYISIFGSFATRLALPTSDLDLVIANTGFNRAEIVAAVSALAAILPPYKWTLSAQPIPTATVPVVKLTVDPLCFGGEFSEQLKVDITFENPENEEKRHIGLAAVKWVKQLLQECPYAQECILALKQALCLRKLNSAYLGGLSSYSLVLWVAAYLRAFPCDTSGELIIGVLRFYGCDFEPSTTGISPTEPHFYPRPAPAFSVCETLDPVSPGNNTTKSAYRLPDVQELFRVCWECLRASASLGHKDPLARLYAQISASSSVETSVHC